MKKLRIKKIQQVEPYTSSTSSMTSSAAVPRRRRQRTSIPGLPRPTSPATAAVALLALFCLAALTVRPAESIPLRHMMQRHYGTVARPGRCADNDTVFEHCFLCGKVSEDGRVYRDCCRGDPTVVLFCDHMMDWSDGDQWRSVTFRGPGDFYYRALLL